MSDRVHLITLANSDSLNFGHWAANSSLEFEDSTYSSTSEAEPDSDREDDDPQKLLGTWLGELENLKLGLDSNRSAVLSTVSPVSSVDQTTYYVMPRIDSYRFSMANLEDSQDVELDAILGELCALENQFDREIFSGSRSHQRSASSVSQSSGVSSLDARPLLPLQFNHSGGLANSLTPTSSSHRSSSHNRSSSAGASSNRPKLELAGLQSSVVDDGSSRILPHKAVVETGSRTDSPDNDSAFSDTVSMLSSESSASSGGGGIPPRLDLSASQSLSSKATQLNAEHAARIKAEKIKIALEKIREASVKKLFIKAFTADGSAKSLLVDEKMSVGYVAKLLVDKNHVTLDFRWSIVEHIPDLHMERVFEDHENLVENLMLWTRDSQNKLLFQERNDKYDQFINSEKYFMMGQSARKKAEELDDEFRNLLIEDFFSGSGPRVPDVEGLLFLKSEGKKAWKKHFFVLRASGLYYCPKGKSKLSKDLVCLVTFDANNVYLGIGWKKKYKAPTEYGFALKHPQIQTKASKFIKYLCAEDEDSFRQWVVGIRVAKFGRQLLDNYRMLVQDIAEDDLDTLAHARSFSISSVARSGSLSTTPTYESAAREARSSSGSSESRSLSATPVSTLERNQGFRCVARQDSVKSSSTSGSGATSERSGNGTPTGGDVYGFECDYPTGTIKRKPSVNPKIPLTSTTRALAMQSSLVDGELPSTDDVLVTRTGTLRKTMSLRRSLTDDRISLPDGTLRRQQSRVSPETNPRCFTQGKTVLSENFESFPPPPPEFAASMESLLSVDSLPLPPPPTDAYKSNLSLDSMLPSPPNPSLYDECGENTTSSISLPPSQTQGGGGENVIKGSAPPPPPKPAATRSSSAHKLPDPALQPATSRAIQSNPVKCNMSSDRETHQMNGHDGEVVGARHRLKSPGICRRITFRDEVGTRKAQRPPPPPPPPLPATRPRGFNASFVPAKPAPPQRSENTRLTAADATLTRNQLTSPKMFLADLQRVMEKKWKVAQQLKVDLNSSPHTVMGFRDPPLPSDVLCCGAHIDEKNRAAAAKAQLSPPPLVTTPTSPITTDSALSSSSTRKKPPPPPKRSETTQLTSRAQ